MRASQHTALVEALRVTLELGVSLLLIRLGMMLSKPQTYHASLDGEMHVLTCAGTLAQDVVADKAGKAKDVIVDKSGDAAYRIGDAAKGVKDQARRHK